MPDTTVTIPTIESEEDVAAIEEGLGVLPGVSGAGVHRDSKQVTIHWGQPATWEKIVAVLGKLGHPPEDNVEAG